VLGSGIEMALCCDVRIASEDAKFGLPEMGLGMIPAAGGTQTVPRLAGIGAALDMILTNKWIDAVSALKTRMVDRVVPRDKLYSETDKLAKKIVVKNKRAIINAKKAVVRGMDLSLTEGLDLEKRLAASHNIY
jgi:enoyl-CoA hydratase